MYVKKRIVFFLVVTQIIFFSGCQKDESPLPSPSGLVVKEVTVSGFLLDWSNVSKATEYRVDISTVNDFSQDFEQRTSNQSQITVQNLVSNTLYYVRVAALTDNNTSQFSDIIEVLTSDLLPPMPVSVTNITVSGFKLHWPAIAGSTGYRVALSTDDEFLEDVTEHELAANMIEFNNLKNNTTYFFRIYTKVNSEESDPSATMSTKTLELTPPGALEVVTSSGDFFEIEWEDHAMKYYIEISENETFSVLLPGYDGITIEENFLFVEFLDVMTTYYVRIKSLSISESSDFSETFAVATTLEVLFRLRSNTFGPGEKIPMSNTCRGANLSPELHWRNPPAGTVSFAIIMKDLDFQSGYNHWILFNIPMNVNQMNEGTSAASSMHGTNNLGQQAYLGPCPPNGQSHRYVFTIFALNDVLTIPSTSNESAFLSAISNKVLTSTTLTGLFE